MASSGDCQKAKDDLQLAQERFSHESEQLTNSHQQKLEALQMEIRQLVRMGAWGGGGGGGEGGGGGRGGGGSGGGGLKGVEGGWGG